MVKKFKLLIEYSGKKITCVIRNKEITDALLIKYGTEWYILQNNQQGSTFPGYKKYGYEHSYYIGITNELIEQSFVQINLLNKIHELW